MRQGQRFKIIRKLDAGGMAEVYHAELESMEGFRKTVAVKKVLPHLVQNEKFMRMFLDEARLCLRLTHANVVQVFDVGQAGGSFYVIMEFVDGTNLKAIMETMRARGTLLPIEQSVLIMVETCKGLQYAHTLQDNTGRPLGIVHRDVSPPNILISKQGEVKLVDFGLAKAADQLEHTDPGVVKGKFSYLSPEAVEGQVVDRRADVFACGILLFETLTGRRLFFGKNDYDTVQQVRVADIPSLSRLNPAVPRDLEQVVLRSLARDLDRRHGSAQELGDELLQFLFSHGLKVTNSDIAQTVHRVLQEASGPGGKATTIIDNLIESELARLTSLDGSENPFLGGQAPLTAAEISGAFDGNLDSLEDPRTWGLDTEGDGIGHGSSPRISTWRETGSFPMATDEPAAAAPEPRVEVSAGPGAIRSRGGAAPAETAVEPVVEPAKKGFGLLVSIALLMAAAAGVLVYLAFFR